MTRKEQRGRQVLEMVRTRRRLDVRDVADALSISEATVRRLFADLERQGLVIRIHGGVQLALHSKQAYSFNQAELHRVDQKLAIAREAVEHISDGGRIFLDSGTTLVRLAECLALRIQEGSLKDITVLTNSLNNAEILASTCKVILIGGEVRLTRRDVCGALSEKMLSRFRVHSSFLGADAVDIGNGFMTTDEQTASMDEIIIERSEQAYVLADSEKFHRNSFVSYAPLAAVDAVITDWEIDADVRRAFEGSGAAVTVVPNPETLPRSKKMIG